MANLGKMQECRTDETNTGMKELLVDMEKTKQTTKQHDVSFTKIYRILHLLENVAIQVRARPVLQAFILTFVRSRIRPRWLFSFDENWTTPASALRMAS